MNKNKEVIKESKWELSFNLELKTEEEAKMIRDEMNGLLRKYPIESKVKIKKKSLKFNPDDVFSGPVSEAP